ncbi:MAG: hypothetical protein Q8P59_08125 [Dehalococcoidia bacterium]|nr:hypothetical protein [Dehalococcoidia bacterium]
MALLGLITLLVFLMTACQWLGTLPPGKSSTGEEASPPIVLGASVSGPDVAVTAVDFDPPLKPNANLAAGDISLLVAVENKGDRREKDIQAVAQIMGKEDELLYSDTRVIDSLAAGEGRVVQFGRLSGLPLRSAYTIKVWVPAVPGELRLENNAKTYRIQISLSSP